LKVLGTKEANILRTLCHEGMLFDVERWIRAGHSVVAGGTPDHSPLAIASGKGFHSLVTLLLAQQPSQDILDAAMAQAAMGDGVETLRLLNKAGATLKNVSVKDAVTKASPDVIEFLVKHGLDVGQDDVLGQAMYGNIQTAMTYFTKYRSRHANVRDQGAKALIYAVRQNQEHVATRLTQAGADPRLRVSPLYLEKYDFRYGSTALEEAASHASFKVFLIMDPRLGDDFPNLLDYCCLKFDIAKIMMLIKRGAVVNDLENGGSTLLRKCLCSLGMGEHFKSLYFRECSDRAWELANKLVTELGAKWNPDADDLRQVRIWMKHVDRQRIYALAALLVNNNATPMDKVKIFFDTPGMRKKLESLWPEVAKLVGAPTRRTQRAKAGARDRNRG